MSNGTEIVTDAETLTEEEIATVAVFISSLQDRGITAMIIVLAAADEDTDSSSQLAAEAVREMLKDLRSTCKVEEFRVTNPANVVDAAPSLFGICAVANELDDVFPEGFVPDDELQKKCLRIFFERVRKDAIVVQDA